MVRCMIRSHNQHYKVAIKGDDAENMCTTNMEPDPRYQNCCSNIFRPGKVLRDVIIGFLVVLAIAVVIAVLFVVCFYLLPETESADKLEESAFVGKPLEKEVNINEVEFTDDTRYDVRPEVVLEHNRKKEKLEEGEAEPGAEPEAEPESEPEVEPEAKEEPQPESEPEPEPETEPEPEPEGDDHAHKHEGDMHHHDDAMHEGHHEHDGHHMHDGHHAHDGHHEHDGHHVHEMHHESGVETSDMPHEHDHPIDTSDVAHVHDHPEVISEMPHGHEHPVHDEAGVPHEHPHLDGEMHHLPSDLEDRMAEEHMEAGHDLEGTAFAPSAPHHDEVLEIVSAPTLDSASPEIPTERTVVSISSPSGPDAKVQVISTESEATVSPDTLESTLAVRLPPLFETLGPRSNNSNAFSNFGISLGETGTPSETQPADAEIDFVFPEVPVEETDAPFLTPEITLLEEPAPTVPGACRPRQLEMCSDLPYGLTSLPNWANDQNDESLIKGSMPFFRDVIVRSGCSPRARQYACGILEPPCQGDGSIIPPCRTFCRSVAATCGEFVISASSLSHIFACENFPDSTDPSVCFDMTQEPCLGREHRCGDGRCVARRLVCDGIPDCVDQSDEVTCPNRVPDFSPAVPSTDIPTPEEETQTAFPEVSRGGINFPTEGIEVPSPTLPPQPEGQGNECPELQCLDGTCLLLSQLNDGVNNCPDGTDEQDFGSLF